MRTTKIVILTAVVALLIEVIGVEVFLRTHKFSAKDQPSWMERAFAQHARNISVPGDAMALKNPRTVNDDIMAEAREHWTEHCATCHGLDGRGDTVIGRSMYPPAPNMNDAQTQQKSDGQLFYIISNGVRLTGMPAWESEDSPEEIWDLVSFIRHLPSLTPDELKQMKGLSEDGEGEAADDGSPAREAPSGKKSMPRVKPHKDKPGAKPHTHSHDQ